MKYLYSITIAFFLVSCGEGDQSEDEITGSGELMSTAQQDTCECSELNVSEDGIHSLNGTPFTGICFSNYPGVNSRYIEKDLLEGQLHGNVTYFQKNGDVMIEEIYEYGEKKRAGSSEALEVECSELETRNSGPGVPTRYFLDDIPFTGTCTSFYADSDQPYVKSKYSEGFLQGSTIYYNMDGSTMYFEEYDKGELQRTVYEGT